MPSIGIDLGTTNSLIAFIEEDRPRLIKNALGDVLTPSAVSVDKDNIILTGAAASERLITHPDSSVASFKRFMGTERITSLNGMKFRSEELSALVLKSLKSDAEANLGKTITEAVISVPAYFNDPQRKATIDAGRLAGLRIERLINEPTAAALAYGLGEAKEGNYLVFDLGGGTFDVSILDKYEDIMEIRATTGDTGLGGDDFTQRMITILAQQLKLNVADLSSQDRAIVHRQSELIKCLLTNQQSAEYRFSLTDFEAVGTINRLEFETACASLLQRLRNPTERAVRDANLSPHQFDAVVLVGGATRMPMVRSLVAKLFGRLPMVSINPDTTVALGAAMQAALIGKKAALKDIVMTDVCPYTLGVASVDDPDDPNTRLSVSAIIERNAVVPVSRNLILATIHDRQRILSIRVYQGESLRPENNILIGIIDVHVPQGPKGRELADIRFTYDINGALQVEVTVVSTGKVYQQIFRNGMGLSDIELEQRFKLLEVIKVHPRDQHENKALIARAERLYEEARADMRDAVRDLIVAFTREISNQKLRDQAGCRKQFSIQLDALERSPF